MDYISAQIMEEQLPPDELTPREQQLLQTYLDQERKARWKKLAGANPYSGKTIIRKFGIAFLILAVLIGAFMYLKSGHNRAQPVPENPAMAARTDLINYPFDNRTVRGQNDTGSPTRSTEALEAYRAHDFAVALQKASPSDHFFIGVCWLQLKDANKALHELEQASADSSAIGGEYFYYRGVALQESGRIEEARQSFQKVLESMSVREAYQSAARKRIGQ